MTHAITARARELRRRRTLAEGVLWSRLRRRRCAGFKFRFQHPVPPYIVDFVCLERRLIIEIDGGQHNEDRDAGRTRYLESMGFQVLRFWNSEVLYDFGGVYQVILGRLGVAQPSP